MILSTFPLQKEEYDFVMGKAGLYLNRYSFLMVKHLISQVGFNRRLAAFLFKRFPITMLFVPFRFIRAALNKKILQR
jgi:succinoglycan biosynthesis protein ExoW